MDYEKRIREYLNNADVDELYKSMLLNLFPELKESEDEKTRKELITHCRNTRCVTEEGAERIAKWLAWFEKQKEIDKVSYEIAEKEKYDFVSGQFIECRKSFNEFKENNSYWFEYVGNDTYIGRSDNILNKKFHITPRQLYRLFTQQHCPKENHEAVDKIEPKFHEGEWIIRSAEGFKHNTYLVKEVKDYYVCEELKGRRVTFTFNDVHKNFKLWDISDAKDGDILDANGAPFIYKKHDKDYVYFYCGVNLAGEFIEANGIDTWNNNNKVYPATKEQCEQLKNAMTDAGYTFDFDKKELKKIETSLPSLDEQQGTPVIDIPFGAKDSELQEASYHIPEGFHAEIQGDKVVIKKGEKKSSWSEEDENNLTDTCVAIRKFYHSTNGAQELIDWFKSLKQRMKGK